MEKYSAYNVLVVLVAAIGSWQVGYGLSDIVPTLGSPLWYKTLGLDPIPTSPGYKHTSSIIATVNGVFFAGAFFGGLLSSYTGDKLGRLNALRLAVVISVLGTGLQAGAVSTAMFIVARVITGLSTGQVCVLIPIYLSEVAPPHARGLMAGMHGCFINVGYATAGWIGFGCYTVKTSTFSWRFPNAVYGILGLMLLAGTFIIPESPRWLVRRGRVEEAFKVLCRLHHDANDDHDTFAHQELALISKQLDEDKKAIAEHGRWQILTLATYRKRLILAALLVIATQNTAVLVINNYNTLLYQSLGLTNTQALIVSASYNTWGMLANFVGAPLSDRFGRRKMLLFGFIGDFIALGVVVGLLARYSQTGTQPWAAAALAFLFIFVSFYACGVDVNAWVYAAEIFPSHLRAQGAGICISALFLADILWLELAPTASATIGWKYYLVFFCLTVVASVYFWFKLPDTTGLALEEIDEIFGKRPAGHITNTAVVEDEKHASVMVETAESSTS